MPADEADVKAAGFFLREKQRTQNDIKKKEAVLTARTKEFAEWMAKWKAMREVAQSDPIAQASILSFHISLSTFLRVSIWMGRMA